jgi:hypothetical protein
MYGLVCLIGVMPTLVLPVSECGEKMIIHTYRQHQRRDCTYKTDETVYIATKLTTFMYCNYKSFFSFFTD